RTHMDVTGSQERDAALRIQREVPRLVVLAVCEPRIDALVRHVELRETPEPLLDVDRVGTAPDLEHRLRSRELAHDALVLGERGEQLGDRRHLEIGELEAWCDGAAAEGPRNTRR